MGKPLNAGIAASNGVECAALAARGLTSCDDGLMGPQGFVETHTEAPQPWPDTSGFLFEDNKYKLHACCHGTHAMIEALRAAPPRAEVRRLQIRVNPRWLRVCDIKAPRTGLEVKFSYAWLAGMVLSGVDTAADAAYTDTLAADPGLADFAARVEVTGDESLSDTATTGTLTLTDGSLRALAHDLDDPVPLPELQAGLRRKAEALIGAAPAAALWAATEGLEERSAAQIAGLIDSPG